MTNLENLLSETMADVFFAHSFIQSFIYWLIHSFIHSFTAVLSFERRHLPTASGRVSRWT